VQRWNETNENLKEVENKEIIQKLQVSIERNIDGRTICKEEITIPKAGNTQV
jgi:hypothetical protein